MLAFTDKVVSFLDTDGNEVQGRADCYRTHDRSRLSLLFCSAQSLHLLEINPGTSQVDET